MAAALRPVEARPTWDAPHATQARGPGIGSPLPSRTRW
jgi:hypothetical protein